MARSHPPTLLRVVERTLREECPLEPGSRLLLAVSGGGDSMAMLHVLARLSEKLGLALTAHGIDHGLRQEAAAELEVVGRLARSLGVPFATTRVELEPGANLQHRARTARYRALHEARRRARACAIATAHHADDRAETVLLRMLRGSGPAGLSVLHPRSEGLVRPLVRATKSTITRHLERHHIAWCSDPSNRDRRFLRVRVREELLPLLVALSPGIVSHLNALADQLTDKSPPLLIEGSRGPVPLGRRQIEQLLRAKARGHHQVEVPVTGGAVVVMDRGSGQLVLQEARGLARQRRK